MKRSKMILMTVATVLAQLLVQRTGSAQPMFRAIVSAVAISTNGSGNLTYQLFGTRDLINNCASEQGLTNVMGLRLVYDLGADALEVVSGTGTNTAVVCTPLAFSDGLSLGNTSGTRIEREAWVMVETNSAASGTLSATERMGLSSSNTVSFFNLIGKLQYTTAASGTNGPAIIRGNLLVGPFFGGHHGGGEGEGGVDQGGDSQGSHHHGGGGDDRDGR